MRNVGLFTLLVFLLSAMGAFAAPCPFLQADESAPQMECHKSPQKQQKSEKSCCCDSVLGCKVQSALPSKEMTGLWFSGPSLFTEKYEYIYSFIYHAGARPPNHLS